MKKPRSEGEQIDQAVDRLLEKVVGPELTTKAWTAVNVQGQGWQQVELEIVDGRVVSDKRGLPNEKAIIVSQIYDEVANHMCGERMS